MSNVTPPWVGPLPTVQQIQGFTPAGGFPSPVAISAGGTGGALGAATGGMGAAQAAARTGMFSGLLAPGTTMRGALGRTGGYGMLGAIGGGLGENMLLNAWDNPGSTMDERVANALQWGATGAGIGAGIGSVVPVIGTGLGAGVGGLLGAAGGFIFGGDERAPEGEDAQAIVPEDLQDTFNRVLTGLGADADYAGRAWAQFQLSRELSPGMTPEQEYQLGQQVLQSAITQLSAEQERHYYESNIAAVQAWMEPLLREQLASAQHYADTYADMGQAAASEISNPALREALMAQGAAYSAQQANANALALQQMAFYPEAMMQQVAGAYEQQIAALEAQQSATSLYGGLPMTPMPETNPYAVDMGGGVPTSTMSANVIDMRDPNAQSIPQGPPQMGMPMSEQVAMQGPPAMGGPPQSEGAPWEPMPPTVFPMPDYGMGAPPSASVPTTVPQSANAASSLDFIMGMSAAEATQWLAQYGHTLSPGDLAAAQAWIEMMMPTTQQQQPPQSPIPTGSVPQFGG